MNKILILPVFATVIIMFVLSASSMVENHAFATTSTDLGQAGNYVILSGNTAGVITNGVANQPIISGNVGHTSTETAPFTFAAGFSDVSSPAILGTTTTTGTPIGDAHAVLTNIGTYIGGVNTGLACTFTHTGAINLLADITHGPVGSWAPGVYCIDGAISDASAGTLTFTGSGPWIFKSNGAFTTVVNDKVAFSGPGGSNANSGNLFFAPIGGASLGAVNQFSGTILAGSAAITTGAVMNATNARFVSESAITIGGGANLFSFPPVTTTSIPEFPFSFSLVIIFVAVAAVYMGIRQKMTTNFKRY